MNKTQLFKNFFLIASPCVIAILLCLLAYIIHTNKYLGTTQGWTYLGFSIFFPAFFILGSVDLLVRLNSRENILRIWIIESIIIFVLLLLILP